MATSWIILRDVEFAMVPVPAVMGRCLLSAFLVPLPWPCTRVSVYQLAEMDFIRIVRSAKFAIHPAVAALAQATSTASGAWRWRTACNQKQTLRETYLVPAYATAEPISSSTVMGSVKSATPLACTAWGNLLRTVQLAHLPTSFMMASASLCVQRDGIAERTVATSAIRLARLAVGLQTLNVQLVIPTSLFPMEDAGLPARRSNTSIWWDTAWTVILYVRSV